MTDLTRTAAKVGRVFGIQSISIDVIASVAVERGQAVVIGTDGQLDLADGSTGGNAAATRGIALNDAAAGQVVGVLLFGGLEGFDVSGLNGDDPVYVSGATAGELADSAGGVSFQVGVVFALPDGNATKIIMVDIPWNN